jgi:hypothetical protein
LHSIERDCQKDQRAGEAGRNLDDPQVHKGLETDLMIMPRRFTRKCARAVDKLWMPMLAAIEES